ncbi:MAG: hypothetical protein ABSF47_00070 [Minisyncoccia bacterium]|jgi:hypothetical protein
MRGLLSKFNQFIRNVQRSDDRTKKRWLTIFSGTGMLIVIVLWVAYLNVTLPRTSTVPDVTSTAVTAPAAPEEGTTFFKTLGLGWENVWSNARNGVQSIWDSVSQSWTKVSEQINRTNNLNLEKPATTSTETAPENRISTSTEN